MNLSIANAVRASSSSCIAFIGAGGKSTALFQIARNLRSPVIVTATTHLGSWQVKHADRHIIADTAVSLDELKQGLTGILLVTGSPEDDRTRPIDEKVLIRLHQFCGDHKIPLLIEADGARQKPMKAWAEHEPPIPSFVNQVVHVAGLNALGKPLDEGIVHRAELFSNISGIAISEVITLEAIIKVLTHSAGGLKNIPQNARRAALLNQADTAELQSSANRMVQPLLSTYDAVIVSNLKNNEIFAVHEPIAGIVLAAGESARYGQAKQLLDWRGETFVRAVARTAVEAGLSPVIVVTGANAESVNTAVQGLDVQLVKNADWKSGQGSSIRTGVLALPTPSSLPPIQKREYSSRPENIVGFGRGVRRAQGVGGAIFLLADQPQVTTSILRALVEKHAEGLYPIVVPMVMDHRANPVLFDLVTFHDLKSIQGDVGGRAIFHKHQVEYLPWHDDRLLLDVDTPEMYRRLISDQTL